MTVSPAAATHSIAALSIGRILWPAPAFPSITTLVVLVDLIASLFHRPILKRADRLALYSTIAVVGIALYATVTGLPGPDLYRVGFSSFAPLVLAIAATLVAHRAPRAAWIAILVLVAFDLQLLRSRNVFDYALDPLVTAIAVAWCLGAAIRQMRGRGSAEGT